AGDLRPLAHLARALRRVPEVLHVGSVDLARALRQQDAKRLTHHLGGGPAEDFLRAVVEERDTLLGVDADDGVGRDADDVGEQGIGESARLGRFVGSLRAWHRSRKEAERSLYIWYREFPYKTVGVSPRETVQAPTVTGVTRP